MYLDSMRELIQQLCYLSISKAQTSLFSPRSGVWKKMHFSKPIWCFHTVVFKVIIISFKKCKGFSGLRKLNSVDYTGFSVFGHLSVDLNSRSFPASLPLQSSVFCFFLLHAPVSWLSDFIPLSACHSLDHLTIFSQRPVLCQQPF